MYVPIIFLHLLCIILEFKCWFLNFSRIFIRVHFERNNSWIWRKWRRRWEWRWRWWRDPCSTRWWIQFAWHGHCACQTYHSSRNFWPGRRIFKILHWIFQPRGLYILIKLRFSEKVTKIWTHFPCNVKTNRFFFQILLWPSQNIWTLLSLGGIN